MIEAEDKERNKQAGCVHRIRISENKHAPLIILVHGRSGNVSVMSIFERTCPKEANLLLVQAPEEDPQGGYSWFVGKTFKEGSIESAPVLKKQIEDLCELYQLMPSKKIGIGFSQGGMVLSVLYQTSTILDAVALVASMPVIASFESRHDAPSVFGTHGTKDETLPLEHVQPWYDKLKNLGFDLRLIIEEGMGHKIGSIGMKELTEWVSRNV